MNQIIDNIIGKLAESGNLRTIPDDASASGNIDLSSNDYLGLASNPGLQDEFIASCDFSSMLLSASASRLLARRQKAFGLLEETLEKAYGHRRRALLFNSGYHANTGLVSAFANQKIYIIADKLVHASIIDGIRLSGLPFDRFRHNDIAHLSLLADKAYAQGYRLLIIAESVYSMDGDKADIDALAEIKRKHSGSMLYIDEAHAVGVEGDAGLGLCKTSRSFDEIDIVVGTFGKALASSGAFAILSPSVREFMVNKARSLIFSTALPPICALWSRFIFLKSLEMDTERTHLHTLGTILAEELHTVGGKANGGHIQPLIVGDPRHATALSKALRQEGFDVLPIRTPTVPPGTDRLRFSLSAAIDDASLRKLGDALRRIINN